MNSFISLHGVGTYTQLLTSQTKQFHEKYLTILNFVSLNIHSFYFSVCKTVYVATYIAMCIYVYCFIINHDSDHVIVKLAICINHCQTIAINKIIIQHFMKEQE